jgi:hypothetical protein
MSPEAERVLLELIRRASPARRASLALSWSRTMMGLARRSLRRSRPEASEDELAVLFVSLHYGDDLAGRLSADLARRRP